MNLILVSLAVATISTTIAFTPPFRWLRVYFENVPGIGKILRCPYCMNHYFAIPAIMTLMPLNLTQAIVGGFAIVALSSIFGYMLLKYLDLLEQS